MINIRRKKQFQNETESQTKGAGILTSEERELIGILDEVKKKFDEIDEELRVHLYLFSTKRTSLKKVEKELKKLLNFLVELKRKRDNYNERSF